MFKFGNYLNIWKCIRTCITLKLLEVTCEVPQDYVLSHTASNLSYMWKANWNWDLFVPVKLEEVLCLLKHMSKMLFSRE